MRRLSGIEGFDTAGLRHRAGFSHESILVSRSDPSVRCRIFRDRIITERTERGPGDQVGGSNPQILDFSPAGESTRPMVSLSRFSCPAASTPAYSVSL